MRKSTKAALLSGLVFPGVGHLVLKRYVQGAILIIVSLVAMWLLVTGTVNRAMDVVDRIESGEVAMDSASIQAAVSDSGNAAGFTAEDASAYVLLIAWLVGIVDCIRLGRGTDK
ncbi:MAG: DUF6677 family protein [Woeseiaceae bacterium]